MVFQRLFSHISDCLLRKISCTVRYNLIEEFSDLRLFMISLYGSLSIAFYGLFYGIF